MRQKILMCPPDFFGVDYVINPWMHGHVGQSDHALALKQWNALYDLLRAHADVALVPPQPGWPDMVFTANAGLVWRDRVVVSRFHAPERQGETPYFADWFRENGFLEADWPPDVPFEGAGDALFDRGTPARLWLSHGFRSASRARVLLEDQIGGEIVSLRLVDPHFYHLDTCLCPLAGGFLLYYPEAFDADSQARIRATVPETHRLAVEAEDARSFVCNAVEIDRRLFVNAASSALRERLASVGFSTTITPLTEFMKAGGSAKCLTLKLVEPVGS